MLFDYSKTHLDAEAMAGLIALAEAADVPRGARRCSAARRINETEGRAVLHTALRAPGGPVLVDGVDVMPGVLETRRGWRPSRWTSGRARSRARAGPIRTW
jgi:glucose-6-phosphate isomerase